MPENIANPESLLLVRSTLEMASLMRRLYPSLEISIGSIEAEVRRGGQLLLEAASIARARVALETIHRARLQLQQLGCELNRIAA